MAYDPANRGGSGGSNYTFSRTPTGQGNWNTGGAPVSTGSFARGFSPVNNGDTNRVGMPTGQRPAVPIPAPKPFMASPAVPIPRQSPWAKDFGNIVDVFGPSYPVDPGIIAQMIRSNRNPVPAASTGSTFHKQPARGAFIGTPRDDRYGNDQFGHTFGGLRNSGGGFVGGGQGGGGGGGF